MIRHCRLDGATTTFLVDTAGEGVPRCLHWGARLGQVDGLASVQVLPVDRVPLTEQGKPDREAIRALGRRARASPSPGGFAAHVQERAGGARVPAPR